jgi:hypothetical protein
MRTSVDVNRLDGVMGHFGIGKDRTGTATPKATAQGYIGRDFMSDGILAEHTSVFAKSVLFRLPRGRRRNRIRPIRVFCGERSIACQVAAARRRSGRRSVR